MRRLNVKAQSSINEWVEVVDLTKMGFIFLFEGTDLFVCTKDLLY